MFDYLPNPFIIPVGLIIGVLVAAPVGPVNVLCVQRAIERGFFGGLAAGIGSVLGLVALFGGVSTFVEVHSTVDALLMVAAIMAGSLMWWISLSNLISRYRHRIDASTLKKVNLIAGILLAGFGGLLLCEVIWKDGRF